MFKKNYIFPNKTVLYYSSTVGVPKSKTFPFTNPGFRKIVCVFEGQNQTMKPALAGIGANYDRAWRWLYQESDMALGEVCHSSVSNPSWLWEESVTSRDWPVKA